VPVIGEEGQLADSRLGLEGLITFKKDTHDFDPEEYTISVPTPKGSKAVIGVFDKVTVDVGIEKDPNTQRGKVVMRLVEPVSSINL
jgi:exosome complex exonuclease DIS3/RRP44